MKNYVVIDGVVYDLVRREEKEAACQDAGQVKLGSVAVGDTVTVGGHEMIVLEHLEAGTALIRKELLQKEARFGDSNNYEGSNVEAICNAFAEEMADIVGEDNMILHEVDLTSEDGLKDYGVIKRRASLITLDYYRKHVLVLDKHKVDAWWWLATPYSTPTHEDADWVKCVAPSGYMYNSRYGRLNGVRPFCILKSDIFVSI